MRRSGLRATGVRRAHGFRAAATTTLMDLNYTPEQQAFRREVRDFIAAHLPADIARHLGAHKLIRKDDITRWQRILHDHGWGAPGWPKEFGGTGWDPVRRHIFEEECQAAHAPRQLVFGLSMVGPVLIAFGTPAQQQFFLPKILSGEHWWCQGYSEPGAGSDLASLKMRAERRGDHYVVNGQKTWNTLGQHADWIFCLVRTNPDARQQEGISFLLIDMKSPGITVRPIVMLDGGREINDIFFDDVKVPVDNRVGDENKRLDLRQVPAGPRARGHRRSAAQQGDAGAAEGDRARGARERPAADRGCALSRQDRAGRDRAHRAGDHAAARALRRGEEARAGPRGLDPQDTRLGNRAAAA